MPNGSTKDLQLKLRLPKPDIRALLRPGGISLSVMV